MYLIDRMFTRAHTLATSKEEAARRQLNNDCIAEDLAGRRELDRPPRPVPHRTLQLKQRFIIIIIIYYRVRICIVSLCVVQ